MADCLGEDLGNLVGTSRVLVVGTGGIGCELLKNLVLSGFKDIVAVSIGKSASAPSSHFDFALFRLTWTLLM